jgi:hypothetical protein
MSRMSSSANNVVAAQAHVPHCVFAELAFDSGTMRICGAVRSYTFTDSSGVPQTYRGIGELGTIDNVRETSQLVPEKVQLTLAGVDNALLQTTLGENYQGRSATIYVGYLNDGGDLVDTPHLLWEGGMSVMTIKADVNVSNIPMVCENRLIFWNKAPGWLYTTEHQQALMGSGDNFFDQLAAIQNRQVKWGGKTVDNPYYHDPNPIPPGYYGL